MAEIIELVPSSDAAPALPSRIVTVNLAGPTEGALTSGERTVKFRLVGDIHASADRMIVGAGYTVTAKSGDRVRLPVYAAGTGEWAIEVKKSWAPHPYAIRIPAGSTAIDLSALKPVITLPSMMSQYAVTGAGITVKQGAQWNASVTLTNGVLGFDLTVPPGGTAWNRGTLGDTDDLDTIDSGTYQALSGATAAALGLPSATPGALEAWRVGRGAGVQRWTTRSAPPRVYVRSEMSGGWGPWREIDRSARTLTASDDIDALDPGRYGITNGAVASSLGLPRILGSVFVSEFGTAGRTQIAVSNTPSPTHQPTLLVRSSHGDGSWPNPEWQQVFPPASPTRTAGMALNFSRGSSTDTRAIVTARIPVKFGANVRRMRVSFRNHDYRSGIQYGSDFAVNGVAFGPHQIGSDGSMTGLFPTDPIILSGALTPPADGRTFSTPWVEVNAKAGEEYLVSYTVKSEAGVEKVYNLGFCFTNGISSGWVRVGDTTAVPQGFSPLSVQLDLEVDEDTPVYAYIGDSLTAGQGSARPGYDSWPNVHARAHGAIAQIYAEPGSNSSEWADPLDPAFRRFAHHDKPDRLYFNLGYNDLGTTRTLDEMKTRLSAAMRAAMGHTSKNLWLGTIFPRALEDPMEQVRDEVNDWLRSLPMGAVGAMDFHAALVDPATNRTDLRWQASPGDAHLTSGGYARIANVSTATDPRRLAITAGALSTYNTAKGI